MAVAFDGGVVLGADSRTTTGAYIANRVSDKITPMTDSIYCCRSGSAADTQAISDYVRYVTPSKPSSAAQLRSSKNGDGRERKCGGMWVH